MMPPIRYQFGKWSAPLSVTLVHFALVHQIKLIHSQSALTPYSCNDQVPFPCKSSGVFSRPGDSSVYYECVSKNKLFTPLCYTCNSKLKTCFDESEQSCVTHVGTSCSDFGPRNMDEPIVDKSYDCSGYATQQNPFPCDTTGVGIFPMPGDKSVYFECEKQWNSKTLEATCKTCPQSTKSCFNPDELICEDNCGKETNDYTEEKYDCTNHNFQCVTMGAFAHPVDPGMYFSCLLINNILVPNCFTCSPFPKSCFNNFLQTCILQENVGASCANDKISLDVAKITRARDYSCENYYDFIFPCENYGEGSFALPGDPTVYFTCVREANGELDQSCATCNEAENSCYHEHTHMCASPCPMDSVENRPTQNKQYNCDLYNNTSYQCTSEGYFAHPTDSTVYFQCVKTDGKLKPVCYTCDSKLKTCFCNQKQTCVKNAGANCGNVGTSPGKPVQAYSCAGYTSSSFPCQHYRTGTYGTPGDVSIFFECVQTGSKWESKCFSCSKSAMTCFNDKNSKCEKCGGSLSNGNKPPVYQCDVSKLNHNCGINGTLSIASGVDQEFQIRCVWTEDHFDVLCIACTDLNRKSKCSSVNEFPAEMCQGRYSHLGTVCIPGLVKPLIPPTTPKPAYVNVGNTAYNCEVHVYHQCRKPGATKFPAEDTASFYSIYCMRKGGGWRAICNKCAHTRSGDKCSKASVVPNLNPVTQAPLIPQTTTKPTPKPTQFLCYLNNFPFDCKMEGTTRIYDDPQEKYLVHCQQKYDHFEAYCLHCRLEIAVGHHVCTIINELPQYAPTWIKLTTEMPAISFRSGGKPTVTSKAVVTNAPPKSKSTSRTKIAPVISSIPSTTTVKPKLITTRRPAFTTVKPHLTTQMATTTVATTTDHAMFEQWDDSLAEVDANLYCTPSYANRFCPVLGANGVHEYPPGSKRYVKCGRFQGKWMMACMTCKFDTDKIEDCDPVGGFNQWPNLDLDELSLPLALSQ